jgi:adiponectin receptor
MPTFKALLEELPLHMHDNEYIKTCYRNNFKGTKAVFMTAFRCHNETCNVWSHFLGKLMFLGLAIFVLTYYPDMEAIGRSGAF